MRVSTVNADVDVVVGAVDAAVLAGCPESGLPAATSDGVNRAETNDDEESCRNPSLRSASRSGWKPAPNAGYDSVAAPTLPWNARCTGELWAATSEASRKRLAETAVDVLGASL